MYGSTTVLPYGRIRTPGAGTRAYPDRKKTDT